MEVIVYTKTGCPWCIGVTNFLKGKSIPFIEKNVREDENLFEEMKALSGQSKAPVVVIDGFMLADTDREAVEEYLKDKTIG